MSIKNIASLGLLILAAASTMACGAATVSVRDGHYAVNGVTTDVNGAIYAAGQTATQYKNAETYQWAVQNGRAYPYPGGVGRNDFSFFGFDQMRPMQQPVTVPPQGYRPAARAVQPQSANAPCANCVTREELDLVSANANLARATAEQADQKATSGLKVLKGMRPAEDAADTSE